jgi:phosphopantetheine binding protein
MGGRQHGYPLLATRLLARIRQTWHIEVPLRDFFAAPTIAHMAVLITAQQAVQTAPDVLAS